MTTLIETHTVHRLNLTLFHPHGVSIIPHWRPEIFFLVSEMWSIDAGRHLDYNSTFICLAKAMHTQAKHRR